VRYAPALALLATMLSMPLVSACVPAAVMTSNALESRAEDSRVFLAAPDRVWPATLKALGQLQVAVTRKVQDNMGGDIDGVWPGGDEVVLRLDQAGEGQTRVQVRVGGLRNRGATDRILTGIMNNL